MKEKLVDRLVITIAPVLVGGLPALRRKEGAAETGFPLLKNVYWQYLGKDIVLQGDLEYV